MDFTKAQESAISSKGKNILVSAAAGSGKTTVLCERIKRGIEAGDYELSEIIVVSFNTESAADIRAKLLKNLSKAYSKSGDIRLFRQIMMLDKAQISTIHSFALKLIKENSDRLGLPAKTRNIDENESELLKSEIMNLVISSAYSQNEDFVELSDHITSDRDGDFSQIFLKLYDKLMNEPQGIELIKQKALEISELTYESFKESAWGKTLLEERTDALKFYLCKMNEAADSYIEGSKGYEVYGVRFRAMADFANALLCAEDEEMLGEILKDSSLPSFQGARAPGHKGENYDYYKGIFDEFKDAVVKKGRIVKEYTKDGFEADNKKNVRLMMVVYDLLCAFERAYSEEKRKRGLIDYTDMERMAHSLLVDKDGNRTDIGEKYSKKFKAVYVDEYQDTNRVQDEIFRAISNGNLFIVGDIKQSIYGFRGACPEIFSRYRREGFKDGGEKIFLSDNFRSDEMVIKFSNGIFSKLMRADDSIGYVDEDDLKHSKVAKENEEIKKEKVELLLFENRKKIQTPDGQEIIKPYSDEAAYVATRIKSQILAGIYKPSEIAILVRSGGEKLSELMMALGDAGVPVSINEKEDYYKKPHVLMVMCLLNFINNPERDIYTAGVLHSDFFGFTTDELISLKSPSKNLWECVVSCAQGQECGENELFRKARNVCAFYEKYKELEKRNGADEVTRRIVDDLGIVNKFTYGLGQAEASLIREDIYKIYKEARLCSERYGMGLSGFVAHLEKLSEMGKSEKSVKGDEEGVRILTIHGSKGLEFKECFLYNCDKAMNIATDDVGFFKKSPFEYESTLGLALPIYDDGGRCVHDSTVLRSIRAKRQRSIKEEELRLLYVALTRAEEKLIITGKGSVKKLDGAWQRPVESALFTHEVFSARSFLDWILLCIGNIPKECYTLQMDPTLEQGRTDEMPKRATHQEDEDEIRERLELVAKEYAYKDVMDIPAKLTVSKLYPAVLDEGEESRSLIQDDYDFELPDFMGDGERRKKGARIGTSNHLFMQFCDLSLLRKNGVEAELQRLVENGYVSKDIAADVDKEKIKGFIKSTLASRIENAKRVYKEQRFNIKLPAEDFTQDEEKRKALCGESIFVQGVIDLVFEEGEEIVLVDYKTDSFGREKTKEYVENALRERYFLQLEYYKKAVEKMFGKVPGEVLIYSFALSDTVKM